MDLLISVCEQPDLFAVLRDDERATVLLISDGLPMERLFVSEHASLTLAERAILRDHGMDGCLSGAAFRKDMVPAELRMEGPHGAHSAAS